MQLGTINYHVYYKAVLVSSLASIHIMHKSDEVTVRWKPGIHIQLFF